MESRKNIFKSRQEVEDFLDLKWEEYKRTHSNHNNNFEKFLDREGEDLLAGTGWNVAGNQNSIIIVKESKETKQFLTYYDVKFQNSSKIFEAELISEMTPDQIQQAERTYNILLEKLNKGEDIDEGLLTGLLGAGLGALGAATIMKSICKALGISEEGALGKLLTSKLVMASIGYTLAR